RGARAEDSGHLISLARQFSLLNLPAERKAIENKLEKSEASFRGELTKSESSYIFVIENLENKLICGSAQVVAKHGTEDEPSYSFQILKRERFSRDLGVGFIHQILRLKVSEDGPTEI